MVLMSCGFLHQNYMTTVAILSVFFKGSNSQFGPRVPGFTLNSPRSVVVQHNLCAQIPCTFKMPPVFTLSRSAQGMWLKGDPTIKNIVAKKSGPDDPQDEYPRFFLTGDVWRGDCSLRISDVTYEDDASYTFRVEDAGVQFSFSDFITKVTVSVLRATPEIFPLQTLVAGEKVTLTCRSPGRCAGKVPKITWEGTVARKAKMLQYTVYNGDGTRIYYSNLTFIPSIGDRTEVLNCNVAFADNLISESIELEVEDAPLKQRPTPVCPAVDYKFIAGIIVGNIVILLLMGLGLLCFIKRHMNRPGNRLHEREGSESAYQNLSGQSIHTYDKIIMK